MEDMPYFVKTVIVGFVCFFIGYLCSTVMFYWDKRND
jgi:hypothetical protein